MALSTISGVLAGLGLIVMSILLETTKFGIFLRNFGIIGDKKEPIKLIERSMLESEIFKLSLIEKKRNDFFIDEFGFNWGFS